MSTPGRASPAVGAADDPLLAEAQERRRQWFATPRGRIRLACSLLAGWVLLSATALAMLVVAVLTAFRKRRLYTEGMARWMCATILKVNGVTLVVHQASPFSEAQTIYTANHTSTLDMFILLALGLPNTRYFLRGRCRRILPLGIIAYLIGTFFTPPQSKPAARTRCFQKAERVLRRTRESVYLSPEGTRVTDGRIGHFNKGTFHLATDLQVPIVPLYIDIPAEVNPGKGLGVIPGTVHVYVLPEVRTEGWRLEDLLTNKEKVRDVYVAFHQERRAAAAGRRSESEPEGPGRSANGHG